MEAIVAELLNFHKEKSSNKRSLKKKGCSRITGNAKDTIKM